MGLGRLASWANLMEAVALINRDRHVNKMPISINRFCDPVIRDRLD